MLLAALEAVSSVSVSYTCTNNSARVDWSAVFGAFSYKATAIGKNGTELSCSSQSTNCQIIGLSCGQNYVVHVNPMSENCRQSMSTTSDAFQTGEKQKKKKEKTPQGSPN